jgi:hypothetical protein
VAFNITMSHLPPFPNQMQDPNADKWFWFMPAERLLVFSLVAARPFVKQGCSSFSLVAA